MATSSGSTGGPDGGGADSSWMFMIAAFLVERRRSLHGARITMLADVFGAYQLFGDCRPDHIQAE
jgi:hypothetical protein